MGNCCSSQPAEEAQPTGETPREAPKAQEAEPKKQAAAPQSDQPGQNEPKEAWVAHPEDEGRDVNPAPAVEAEPQPQPVLEQPKAEDPVAPAVPLPGAVPSSSSPPPVLASYGNRLQLVRAFGYNGRKARDNIHCVEGGVVTHVGAAGVVFTDDMEQRFFTEHSHDILCLAVHPNGRLVATGQSDTRGGEIPSVCVWDTQTLELKKRIYFHSRGISCVAFSHPEGKYLATVGEDEDHSVALWDWENTEDAEQESTPLFSSKFCKNDVFNVAFNPAFADTDALETPLRLVSVGKKHVDLWHVSVADKSIDSQSPSTFAKTNVIQDAYHSVAFLDDGKWIATTHDGNLHIFQGKELERFFKAHNGPCGAIVRTDDGYVTAGDDDRVKVWSSQHDLLATVNLSEHGNINARALAWRDGKLLLGSRNNDVLSLDLSADDPQPRFFLRGHFKPVYSATFHPSEPLVASVGHDDRMRVWDMRDFGNAQVKKLGEDARTVAFNPAGDRVVVGFKSGRVALFDYPALEELASATPAKETVDCIAFSPDGQYVAAGSYDQFIHVLKADDLDRVVATSSILALDWSNDGTAIAASTRDYERLLFTVPSGDRLLDASDEVEAPENWSTWTTLIGTPVKGIWKDTSDKSDINGVYRSPNHQLLAGADDSGIVRLYSFPADDDDADYQAFKGHGSHVMSVRFDSTGEYVVTVGGDDMAVFVWRVVA